MGLNYLYVKSCRDNPDVSQSGQCRRGGGRAEAHASPLWGTRALPVCQGPQFCLSPNPAVVSRGPCMPAGGLGPARGWMDRVLTTWHQDREPLP